MVAEVSIDADLSEAQAGDRVVEVKPETPSAIAVCEVILSGVPPNDAVDVAVKPVPATVAVKEPSGNVAGFSDWITGAG